MPVRHVVIWRLREDIADFDTAFQQISSRLKGLLGVIPGLTSLQVGRDLGDSEANWDVVLVSEHESVEALELYQSHPAHLEVAGFVREHVTARAAVDYLVTGE